MMPGSGSKAAEIYVLLPQLLSICTYVIKLPKHVPLKGVIRTKMGSHGVAVYRG